jgi:hypothetical protein
VLAYEENFLRYFISLFTALYDYYFKKKNHNEMRHDCDIYTCLTLRKMFYLPLNEKHDVL